VSDSGNVKSHSAYDPYGATNDAGSGIAVGERDPETELGYQSESADAVTGNILVGPRQYDPTTQRFTSADVFIDAGSDLSLATDPLTGNRYLFAAANPVALDDDGHEPCLSDCNRMYSGTKEQQREREADRDRERFRRNAEVRERSPGEALHLSAPGTDGEQSLEAYCNESWTAAQQEQAGRGVALDAWPDTYSVMCGGGSGGRLEIGGETVGYVIRGTCLGVREGAVPVVSTGVGGVVGGPPGAATGFGVGMAADPMARAVCIGLILVADNLLEAE
jgi:RHS repeat-associated protein